LVLPAAALLALSACSSGSGDSKATAPAATPSVEVSGIQTPVGVPPEPTGAERAAYLAAVTKAAPTADTDPGRLISDGLNQCSTLNGPGDPTGHLAAQRFGSDASPVTDEQGLAIDIILLALLCPKS
jgi:hypothetical protein